MNQLSQFPSDALPQLLQCLSADQSGVAPMAALTILGSACGSSVRVLRQSSLESVSPQLFLMIQSCDGQVSCMAELLAPLREFQQRMLANSHNGEGADTRQIKESR